MQKQNLNQQRSSYRKRKCIVYKPNDYFESFDRSQHQLILSYEKQAEVQMVKSLAILVDNIRKAAKPLAYEPSSPKGKKAENKNVFMSMAKNVPSFKKNLPETIIEEDEATNPEKEIEDMIVFEKTGKKIDKSIQKMNYCKEEPEITSNPIQQKKHDKLMDSLKKLSISEDQELEKEIENISHQGNRAMTEDTNLLSPEIEAMKGKPISELILYSNSKKNEQYSPIESENSEYEVTDHSSNESSNDEGDYEERFAFDSHQKPLFGTIFAQGGKNFKPVNQGAHNFINGSTESIVHPQPKLNFKPLLDSPKKSKTKKKRVYINKKKVPRWAEDLKDVAKLYGSEHQKNLRSDFKYIFGVCIVQNLQTNPMFDKDDAYVRSSTVKWNQNKFLV